MLQLSYSWLAIAVDVSFKSLLVGLVAGMAMAVLRVRDTNVRHRVWTAVLAGMLAMPLLVLLTKNVTPAVPLPSWMTVAWQVAPPELAGVAAVAADAEQVAANAESQPEARPEPVPDHAARFTDLQLGGLDDFSAAAEVEAASPVTEAPAPLVEPVQAASEPPSPQEPPRASEGADSPRLRTHWPLLLAAAYLAVTAALLGRFAVGLVLTRRLVRGTRAVDPRASRSSTGTGIRLLEHPQVFVPLTVGFLRPVILLPATWRNWSREKLEAVLAHELAHVRRADWLVAVFAELNRALYWFHPLAWFLRHRLATLAEQNCDDAVLEAHGDRAEYARYLLEVAAALAASGRRARAPLQTTAMARVPSVETRIDAILDPGRPLARRLGAIGIAVLSAVGVPAILLAAALQPGSREVDKPATTNKTEAMVATEADDSAEHVDEIKRILGRVLGPDGKPVAGAEVSVVAVHMGGAPGYPQCAHRILATIESGAEGQFELEFSTDYPERSELESQLTLEYRDWRLSSAGWQVVAQADGYGAGWLHSQAFDEGGEPALQLANDSPIEGRIVDLEGQPLTGVSVRLRELHASPGEEAILDWIQEAREKPQPPSLQEYFFRSDNRYPSVFPRVPMDGGLAMGSPAIPSEVTTDEEGRFQFVGVGADRLVILEVEAPTITKSLLHVVTQDMEPVSARKLVAIGVHTPLHYGRRFEYVAQPSQPIEGHVTDAESGEPLAGMFVQVQMFAENTFGQDGFLTTRTDAEGRYRLEGAPQGGGHHIEVMPTIDQPYFPTDREAERGDGFEPVTCNFELRRGLWIRGKLTETDTDGPIIGATVQYLPLRSNKHAEQYPNYDPQISGSVPSDRYRTAEDGSFHVLAIPGEGILTAIAQQEDRHMYYTLGTEGVPDHLLEGDGRDYLKTYHPWTASGYHTLREVQLPESADEVAYDLHMTRGLTRRVEIVDEDGRRVTGARVLGRVFPASNLEQPFEGSSLEIIGLRPNDRRIVAFLHPEMQIGKALVLSPGEEMTIALEPCAVVRGRVVDADAEPVQDVEVQVSIDSREMDNWHRALTGATTDADGRFEVLLPPGLTYRVWHYSRAAGPNFSAECKPNTGEVIDLGDVTDGAELKAEDTANLTRPRPAANLQSKAAVSGDPLIAAQSSDTKATPAETAAPRLPQSPFIYEGQVLTPDGQPAAGAKLHLVYWYSDTSSTAHHNPVAETGADGRFRFEMSRDDFHRTGDSVPPWQWASLVAAKDGYGMAWATSLAFEKTGAVLEEMSDPSQPAARDVDRLRRMIAEPQGRLRLMADDIPVQGRLVDTEGQPIAGASVRLLEVYQGQDGTLDAWLAAAQEPRADFYTIRQTVPSHLYGPLAQQLTAPVRTDDHGRFTVRGIGRERLARLLVEAPHIEWSDIYCRTRPGETIEISVGMSDRTQLVHGPEFSHVAAPSKPVVGVVRDKERGEPLAGVVIQSHRAWVSTAPGDLEQVGNDFSRAVTDEKGRYKLRGLPKSQRNQLEFIPPDGIPYLPTKVRVDTRGTDAEPVEADAELLPGVTIQGRVTDAETGRGVSGELAYLVADENPAAASLRQAAPRREQPRADIDGRFRLVVAPGPGYVAFTAFGDAYEKRAARPEDASPFGSTAFFYAAGGARGPEYHAVAKLDLAEDAKTHEIEMQVHRGRIVSGTIVDPAGRPLEDGGMYAGRTDGASWRPINDGKFVVTEYEPTRPRRVTFVHHGRQLAGTHILQGDIDQELRVPLQPWGTVAGRVIDEHGDPIADLRTTAGSMEQMLLAMPAGEAANAPRLVMPLPPPGEGSYDHIVTDDEGRFVIAGLVPGERYSLAGFQQSSFVPERKMGNVAEDLVVEPGETLDLGDVTLEQPDLDALRRAAEKRAEQAPKPVPSKESIGTNARAASSAVLTARPSDGNDVERIEGRILAEDGQLPRGVRLFKIRAHLGKDATDTVELPVSSIGADGSFEVSMENFPRAPGELPMDRWVDMGLYATAPQHGFAWRVATEGLDPSQPVELELVRDDVPIRGKVIDTEGKAVAGLVIGIQSISAAPTDDLSEWLAALQQGTLTGNAFSHLSRRWNLRSSGIPPEVGIAESVTTRADGSFILDGIGRERVAMLTVEGHGIERQEFHVATREMSRLDLPGESPIHGAECTFVVKQGLTIEGIVRDAATREPLEGVTIRDSTGAYHARFQAMTDADGRYLITGFPTTSEDRLIAVPNDLQPYLMREAAVQPSSLPGERVVRLDFDLHRGLWITGRVTEAGSGEPVKANLHYLPFLDNPYAQALPEFSEFGNGQTHFIHLQHRYQTAADGTFRIVALPGRAIVAANGYGAFRVGIGAEEIEGLDDEGKFATYRNPLQPGLHWPHALEEIDPTPDQREVRVDFELVRGERQSIRVIDGQGQPLTNTYLAGINPRSGFEMQQMTDSQFEVHGLAPEEVRTVLVRHKEHGLAAVATIDMRGPRPPAMDVTLAPGATVRGRLVDRDGEGVPGITVDIQTLLAQNVVRLESAVTDDEGDFRFQAIPGPIECDVRVRAAVGRLPESVRELQIEPGETRDLGAIRLVSEE